SGDISYPERLKSVQSGQYDALVLPSNYGEAKIIKKLGLKIKATEPVQINKTYLLIHKSDENKELSEAVNKALKELKDDGTLSDLSNQYYGEDVFEYDK